MGFDGIKLFTMKWGYSKLDSLTVFLHNSLTINDRNVDSFFMSLETERLCKTFANDRRTGTAVNENILFTNSTICGLKSNSCYDAELTGGVRGGLGSQWSRR